MAHINDAPDPDTVTVHEVAVMKRLSDKTVYNLVKSGDIPSERYGRSIRIPADFNGKSASKDNGHG